MNSASEIVLGSGNRKKAEEIARLLEPNGIRLLTLADFADRPHVEEDGQTFAENAAKKASTYAKHFGKWVIGEDSGIVVDALGGRPGVFSARYSGPDATDEKNNAKLLEELAGVPEEKRTAHYVCHVAVADPEGKIRLSLEACCYGRIATEPRGTNGFGYDPLFLIPEYHRTFGELGPVVKDVLSHRARAFRLLIPKLVRVLRGEGG